MEEKELFDVSTAMLVPTAKTKLTDTQEVLFNI